MNICISASIKFKINIIEAQKKILECHQTCELPNMEITQEQETYKMTKRLVFEHFKKIGDCDILYVVNPNGYIGNSVKIEIGYAKGLKKPVIFAQKTGLSELDCLADDFMSIDEIDEQKLSIICKSQSPQPCIPVVSAIIERIKDGEKEILIQTRYKPAHDPKYSGTIEIPAGWIDAYENIYDALKREVKEETGLTITTIFPDIQTQKFQPHNDNSFAFIPFCCQQQTKGPVPWIGFAFICNVKDEIPVPQKEEVRDIRWIRVTDLKNLIHQSPEKFFTLQLGVLHYYLDAQK